MTKKAHCANHKRYVHNCPACQSEALKETVGFPKHEEAEEETTSGVGVGGGTSEAAPEDEDEDEEGGDIAEWEPEMDDSPVSVPAVVPAPLPGYKPADPDIDETEAAMAAEGEFDEDGQLQEVSLVPGEGEPNIPDGTPNLAKEMSPIDVAMALFPRRLIPEGATEVCDEERPDEPYMASYEELVRRAVEGYLETGLTPEDAVIVVAAEVIEAEQLGNQVATEGEDALTEEELEAFNAGVEASPELTGCIEDYNNGFNTGVSTLLATLVGYYGGDTDAPAFSMLEWLRVRAAEMKK